MSDSVYTSTAYLRGLSNLGGVGLNLTFIILGLAWIAIVNLIELALRTAVVLLKVIGRIMTFVISVINMLLNMLSAIAEWVNNLTGPAT
jgi:hypothetical protein